MRKDCYSFFFALTPNGNRWNIQHSASTAQSLPRGNRPKSKRGERYPPQAANVNRCLRQMLTGPASRLRQMPLRGMRTNTRGPAQTRQKSPHHTLHHPLLEPPGFKVPPPAQRARCSPISQYPPGSGRRQVPVSHRHLYKYNKISTKFP